MGRHPGGISISRVLHVCMYWVTDSRGACLAVTNTKFARQLQKGPFFSARLRVMYRNIYFVFVLAAFTVGSDTSLTSFFPRTCYDSSGS